MKRFWMKWLENLKISMKWLENLKISLKIIGSFLVSIVLIIIVGTSGLVTSSRLGSSLNHVFTNNLQPIEYLAQLQEDIAISRADIQGAVVAFGEPNTFLTSTNTDMKNAKTQLSAYESTSLSNAEQQVVNGKVGTAWKAYEAALQKVESDLNSGNIMSASSLTSSTLDSEGNKLSSLLSQLMTMSNTSASQADTNAHALVNTARWILIGIIILSIVIGLGLAIAISQMITRPLQKVVALVSKVAKGDLRDTTDINTRDEVGQLAQSVNAMVAQLREIMSGVLSAAENVSAASQEIAAATEQIASGSTAQAESAETVNQVFRELSTAINSVAKNAEEAAELSSKTADVARNGEVIVQDSVSGMNKVREQIARLNEDSNRVGEIVEVIDDIADQTNLLALNAAIEAARAGDQGRGFAVVADEVRKLAERSGEATKQINTIIKTMQANTQASVQAVQAGVASTQKSGDAFSKIVSMVNSSADKVTEIAAAGEEQSAQASEVLVSVETIAAAAHESAASSEETASSTQSLAQLAEELNRYVSVFKVN